MVWAGHLEILLGVRLMQTTENLYVYKNGTIMNSGTPAFTGLTNGPYYFVASERSSNITAQFWSKKFKCIHSVPAGYKTLCAENIATPSIFKGKDSVDQKSMDRQRLWSNVVQVGVWS